MNGRSCPAAPRGRHAWRTIGRGPTVCDWCHARELVDGTVVPPATGHPPDWRDMTRDAFDRDAPPTPLFELEPDQLPVPATADTGDLLELLDGSG